MAENSKDNIIEMPIKLLGAVEMKYKVDKLQDLLNQITILKKEIFDMEVSFEFIDP